MATRCKQYLRKRSSQLSIEFSPELHERHGSNSCSMGWVKHTHTYAPASPWIPELDSLFHVLVKVLVITLQLVSSHPAQDTHSSSVVQSTHLPLLQTCSGQWAHTYNLSQTLIQASLKHASCFTRTVRYLHKGFSHSDCGLVPLSAKRWLESEWEQRRRGGERRGEEGGRRGGAFRKWCFCW